MFIYKFLKVTEYRDNTKCHPILLKNYSIFKTVKYEEKAKSKNKKENNIIMISC